MAYEALHSRTVYLCSAHLFRRSSVPQPVNILVHLAHGSVEGRAFQQLLGEEQLEGGNPGRHDWYGGRKCETQSVRQQIEQGSWS